MAVHHGIGEVRLCYLQALIALIAYISLLELRYTRVKFNVSNSYSNKFIQFHNSVLYMCTSKLNRVFPLFSTGLWHRVSRGKVEFLFSYGYF